MIDRVHFENFKSLKNVTVDLGRLTVLVGPNGCGKSTVLQGIHLLSQTGLRRPPEARHLWLRFAEVFGGTRNPRRLALQGSTSYFALQMHERDADGLRLEVQLPAATTEGSRASAVFNIGVAGPEGPLATTVPMTADSENPFLVLDHPRVRRFSSVVYLHLDASEMTRTSVSDTETPRMDFNGHGLASTLAWMKGAAEDDLARITEALGRVVPGVRRIRTLRERVPQRRMDKVDIDGQPVWRPVDEAPLGDRFEIEYEGGTSIPADLLSEGTVLALGLLTKLHEPARPRLVLLDDVDRGLHIEAQAQFVQVLRDLIEADPELQIVCTTHSPYLLDLFKASEVRVLALDGDRHTHARALTEHPEFSTWRFGTQTGELWAALGSAWVAAPEQPPG